MTTDHAAPSALEAALSIESQAEQALQADYRRRMATFTPAVYFAKPPSLSPVVLARFGYQIIEPNMMQCQACHQILAIVIPDGLSLESKEKLTSEYYRRLATTHAPTCRFRDEIEDFQKELEGESATKKSELDELLGLDDDDDEETVAKEPPTRANECILPSTMVSILPLAARQLLENPQPQARFLRQCQSMLALVPEHVGNSMLSALTSDLGADWYVRMVEWLEAHLPPGDQTRLAGFLVLLGWQPIQPHFECPFCLARLDLQQRSRHNEEPLRKIPRLLTRTPFTAHCHYCPMVVGFPTGGGKSTAQPLWKSLAERLLAEPPAMDPETAHASLASLHQQLQAALSPEFRRQERLRQRLLSEL